MELKNKIENQLFDEERALYNLKNTEVLNCIFAGQQDGESVLKETRSIRVVNSKFSLRYPLWHAKKYELIHSTFDELTRAPIWYSVEFQGKYSFQYMENLELENCKLDTKKEKSL